MEELTGDERTKYITKIEQLRKDLGANAMFVFTFPNKNKGQMLDMVMQSSGATTLSHVIAVEVMLKDMIDKTFLGKVKTSITQRNDNEQAIKIHMEN